MLFNSQIFIYGFLPFILLIYSILRQSKLPHKNQYAIAFLVLASLFFYGWWKVSYLALIIQLVLVNFYLGYKLSETRSKLLLILALGLNLSVLGYFKYASFLSDNFAQPVGLNWDPGVIILPLGISFFIFQIVAYLVDAYEGKTKDSNLLNFSLFITFFPQLVAGPIVHHKEMMPQFEKDQRGLFWDNLMVGITIFIFGLFKKVILADGIAEYANPVFDAASRGEALGFGDAWGAALAYTLQIYFDFSGYSDMAVGLARMFGIVLPINFFSPYKATSIIEFWRRWHITLSRFLRDYLYIPLGGNRGGYLKQFRNLLITMLLGGLWHGAAWTFVLWGAAHGLFLVVTHFWQNFVISSLKNYQIISKILKLTGWVITFLFVVFAWVVFRTEDLLSAELMYHSMLGLNGVSLATDDNSYFYGFSQMVLTGLVLSIALFLPNSMAVMREHNPALHTSKDFENVESLIVWRPNFTWACVVSCMAIVSLISLSNPSDFLYFNF